ncbi:sugar phosphate isomerase/epimerase family protein [Croceivirga thetidis]|uniref:Sugar phosphate isomerase/epimerase n=1 Tax=Croceivirga thetidis TaxID=2721623 RepID=A0ABX1GLZ0_9FLAO|nr:sugar phosphate isomerase/epimerase [Croceivirga thetidis]NKI30589.1 sugar phosphate isomerase/epimerase [Croceivirga thetidis]
MAAKTPSIYRRQFLKKAIVASIGASLYTPILNAGQLNSKDGPKPSVKLCGHLWVYASKYPPDWNCTPILEQVFSDMSYAGLYGVELMEILLREKDAVPRISEYSKKYNLKVSGSSYGVGFQMCDSNQHQAILEDIKIVVPKLSALGGETFGISVGGVGRIKTEKELDDQALILEEIMHICEDNGIQPNLHNHTYEVENDLHDLKGTLERIPSLKLGPDINWLIRAGVDPVEFIEEYGDRMVYLHLRDEYADGTWTEYLGQGATDFSTISEVLSQVDFKGIAAIELAFPSNFKPTLRLKESWKKSYEFVADTFDWQLSKE